MKNKMQVVENPWGESTPVKPNTKSERLGGPSPKLSSRVSQKFERTKDKVKEGASSGVNWLKLKCTKNKK